MAAYTTSDIAGSSGRITLHQWREHTPRYIALIAHGYGEQARRYDHVAQRLTARGRHEMFNETNKDTVLTDLIGFIDSAVTR